MKRIKKKLTPKGSLITTKLAKIAILAKTMITRLILIIKLVISTYEFFIWILIIIKWISERPYWFRTNHQKDPL